MFRKFLFFIVFGLSTHLFCPPTAYAVAAHFVFDQLRTYPTACSILQRIQTVTARDGLNFLLNDIKIFLESSEAKTLYSNKRANMLFEKAIGFTLTRGMRGMVSKPQEASIARVLTSLTSKDLSREDFISILRTFNYLKSEKLDALYAHPGAYHAPTPRTRTPAKRGSHTPASSSSTDASATSTPEDYSQYDSAKLPRSQFPSGEDPLPPKRSWTASPSAQRRSRTPTPTHRSSPRNDSTPKPMRSTQTKKTTPELRYHIGSRLKTLKEQALLEQEKKHPKPKAKSQAHETVKAASQSIPAPSSAAQKRSSHNRPLHMRPPNTPPPTGLNIVHTKPPPLPSYDEVRANPDLYPTLREMPPPSPVPMRPFSSPRQPVPTRAGVPVFRVDLGDSKLDAFPTDEEILMRPPPQPVPTRAGVPVFTVDLGDDEEILKGIAPSSSAAGSPAASAARAKESPLNLPTLLGRANPTPATHKRKTRLNSSRLAPSSPRHPDHLDTIARPKNSQHKFKTHEEDEAYRKLHGIYARPPHRDSSSDEDGTYSSWVKNQWNAGTFKNPISLLNPDDELE